jgi:hypothetical protein
MKISMKLTHILAASLLVLTAGCGGGNDSAPVSTPPPDLAAAADAIPEPSSEEAAAAAESPSTKTAKTNSGMASAEGSYLTALQLWRNDLPSKHPKGSCAACHGANFFDLARGGSTDSDIVRRALLDGATPAEAEALRTAVKDMRWELKLRAADARTRRPFQPSGKLLLPDLNEAQWNTAAVKRDIAFAENLAQLAPTLYGQRVATLAQALKARDEMLDIARGSNTAGANVKKVQLRELPVGIEYPLWSADKFHKPAEGSLRVS